MWLFAALSCFLLQLDAAALYRSNQADGIAIRLLLNREDQTYTVSPETVFRTGERIRLQLETNFNGFVYVFNADPERNLTLLFPTQQTGMSNQVQKGQAYQIPNTGWFKFAGETGTETLYVLMSPTQLEDVEQQFKEKFASSAGSSPSHSESTKPANLETTIGAGTATGTTAATTASGSKSERSSARAKSDPSTLSQVKSGVKTVNDIGQLPLSISRTVQRYKRRDLVFTTDEMEKTAYVSIADKKLQHPVIFELHLVHRSGSSQ